VLSPFLPPPPPSSGPPSRWGDVEALGDLLHSTSLGLEATSDGQVKLSFADASEGATFLTTTAGHVMAEKERLESLGAWEALHDQLAQFVDERSSVDGDRISLDLDYLLAVALKN